ncbi:hypothetical protein, partial [Geomicrobium sp. JCM 19037]|uniref:hypothetical protein n=1 Tax=Geomicrobium sp. JCM 19037 TaxID=1460634 RepID=UPI0005AA9919
ENGVTFADGFVNAPIGVEFDVDDSTAVRTEDGIGFGRETQITDYERENVTVAEGVYSTEGNGGRKLVRLENGWLVSSYLDYQNGEGSRIRFKVSRDGGNSWLTTFNWGWDASNRFVKWSIVAMPNNQIGLLFFRSDLTVISFIAMTLISVNGEKEGLYVSKTQASPK